MNAAIEHLLIQVDKWVNGYVLGRDPDQTISAAAYQIELAGVTSFWRESIDKFFYPGHCQQAWENEMMKVVTRAG